MSSESVAVPEAAAPAVPEAAPADSNGAPAAPPKKDPEDRKAAVLKKATGKQLLAALENLDNAVINDCDHDELEAELARRGHKFD